jgi:hypothetical protein
VVDYGRCIKECSLSTIGVIGSHKRLLLCELEVFAFVVEDGRSLDFVCAHKGAWRICFYFAELVVESLWAWVDQYLECVDRPVVKYG